MIIELNEQTRVKRVKALCQAAELQAAFISQANLKFITLAIMVLRLMLQQKQNGFLLQRRLNLTINFHSRKMVTIHLELIKDVLTARMPIRSIDTRFVKLVFKKKPDAYADKSH